MPQTNEKAFESYVEKILLSHSGWAQGTNSEWDKATALFPEQVLRFLRETQPKLWKQMEALHGSELGSMVVKALTKELDLKGQNS